MSAYPTETGRAVSQSDAATIAKTHPFRCQAESRVPRVAQTADVWVSVPGLKPRTKTHYLRQEKLWGNDDRLFPATKIVVGPAHHFQATGLKPEHWRTAAPIRAIFRKSFTAAGLRYFNPHSVRNTLVSLVQ